MNETSSFQSYTNPYNSTQITHGYHLPNSTTNAAFVYRPSTMTTSWPYLLIGIVIDLASTIWTCYSNNDRCPTKARGVKGQITDLVVIGLASIRAWSVFIRAIKALLDRGASYMSPTALALLFLGMVPNAIRPQGILFYTVAWNMIMSYSAFEMTVFRRYQGATYAGAGDFDKVQDVYGGVSLSGGNCPRLGCFDATKWIGCNSTLLTPEYRNDMQKEISKDFGPSKVAAAELSLGVFYSLGGAAFLFYLLPYFLCGCFKRHRQGQSSYRSLKSDTDYDDPDFRERRSLWALYATIAIFVTGIIIVPIHVDQQTKQYTVQVWDSTGPFQESAAPWNKGNWTNPVNGSLEGNGSWSDCFEVPFVHDKWGFIEFWWHHARYNPLEWIGVV